MKYSELFYSIQGEGGLLGVPSVFFRTSGCNLRCQWCDSAYTSWQPENKDISVEQALTAILSYSARHVVITGGEPCLQAEALTQLCAELRALGKHITLETNATLFVPIQADLISMSPKLANSTPHTDARWSARHERDRLQLEVMQRFLAQYTCQVKFVVDQPADLAEIHQLVAELNIAPEQVILMPQGTQLADLADKQTWLVEACKTYGYRYSPRLHILIWGNERGI